jgi:hypothetical protein
VRNREALRIRTCPCNECVKNHFEEVLRGVYPTEEAHRAVVAGAASWSGVAAPNLGHILSMPVN